MEIGSKIRYHRTKNKLTQEQLAEGIISVPYLSKIENNASFPSDDVVFLLCERLHIDKHNLIEEGKELIQILFEINNLILEYKLEKAKEILDEMNSKIDQGTSYNVYFYYHLFQTRYYLQVNNISAAEECLEEINSQKELMDPKILFYFHLINGLLHYYKNNLVIAWEEIQICKNYYDEIDHLSREEKADYYFLVALISSLVHEPATAILYGKEALSLYQTIHNSQMSQKLHIIIGINYKNTNEFNEALDHYYLADKIATANDDEQSQAIIMHNIGVVYAQIGHSFDAIKSFEKSYSLNPTTDIEGQLDTIHMLIVENYRRKNYDKCLEWIQCGEHLLEMKYYQEVEMHLMLYKKLINGEEGAIQYITDTLLPYFQKKDKVHYQIRYSIILSDLLEKERRYKESSKYLKLALSKLKRTSTLGGYVL